MKRIVLLTIGLLLSVRFLASAGTLSGNAKAGNGPSVIYLESVSQQSYPAPTEVYKMDQKGMKFVPDLLVVPRGATVEFLNHDSVAHNVRWPSIGGDKRFGKNLGTFPEGQKGSFKFDHPGSATILCTVHPEMSATILVTPSPYYAQADEILGDYFIQNIPDGQYKATVWHNGKSSSKPVTVAGNTKADFTVPK